MAEIIEQVDIREANLDLVTGDNSVTVTAVSNTYGLAESEHSNAVGINTTGSLGFKLSSDGTYFIVTGIGGVTEKYITIPSEMPDENSQMKPVKEIAKLAFAYTDIISVKIPGSITNIPVRAFFECSSLTTVEIAEGVKTITTNAFANCSALTSVELPISLTSIGDGAFSGCSKLNSDLMFSSKMTSIGENAFDGCSQLKKIIFSISAVGINIGSKAFQNTGITSVRIPSSVAVLGSHAFHGCTALASVKFVNNENLTEIGAGAFYGCTSLTDVVIPEGVVNIREYAFTDCIALENVKLANSVKEIGRESFKGCTQLSILRWGDNNSLTERNKAQLERIGHSAFKDCSSLTYVSIPASVTHIDINAFAGCGPDGMGWITVWFDDNSTWFVDATPSETVSKATLVTPEEIDTGIAQTVTDWTNYYWFKLKQMPAPTVDYNPSTFILKMTDSSGLADYFKIYVKTEAGRVHKATINVT